MLRINCPQCGDASEFPKDLAGGIRACKECGQKFVLLSPGSHEKPSSVLPATSVVDQSQVIAQPTKTFRKSFTDAYSLHQEPFTRAIFPWLELPSKASFALANLWLLYFHPWYFSSIWIFPLLVLALFAFDLQNLRNDLIARIGESMGTYLRMLVHFQTSAIYCILFIPVLILTLAWRFILWVYRNLDFLKHNDASFTESASPVLAIVTIFSSALLFVAGSVGIPYYFGRSSDGEMCIHFVVSIILFPIVLFWHLQGRFALKISAEDKLQLKRLLGGSALYIFMIFAFLFLIGLLGFF